MNAPLSALLMIAILAVAFGCDNTKPDKARRPLEQQPTDSALGPSAATTTTENPRSEAPKTKLNLVDVTDASGIDFVHQYDGHDQRYIIEAVGSGIATLDFDADGLLDIFFLNGSAIPVESGPPMTDVLYRNLGKMKFTNVTSPSRSNDRLFGMGIAVADYDSDGFSDILITNHGPNRLLRNNGDGTFEDATAIAGVAGSNQLGAGACFLDADRDGHLDLFVGNYVKSPAEKNVQRTTEGFPSYPGPLDFETEGDFLYHNNADGTFADISSLSGIGLHSSTSMGSIAADIDNDGDTDLFVVNDVDRNFLFENDGNGHFAEVGIQRGVAFSHDGKRNGNMGVDCGDIDGDGALDFFTTTFSNELPVLYHNDGSGNFIDATIERGSGVNLLPHANWGTALLDIDNDCDLDLFIANGHTDPNVSRWAYTTSWKVANSMLINDGKGHFQDVSTACGNGLNPVESSRGVAGEDFDRDGDIDLIVLNSLARPTMIENASPSKEQWLQLDLRGRTANRDAIGARVTVEAHGKQMVREVHSGRGYQSSFGQRLHFGLGSSDQAASITIRWPDGNQQELANVPANQILMIIQPMQR